jgi:glyoxylase-like metal-dependent hydrolase (beta-lactamase superfamily II)
VVDTGMGNKLSEKELQMWQLRHVNGGLIDGLARLGLTSADIDLVINTHLHADHVGGSTTFAPDGRIVPTFLNAEHVVQRREYEDAMHPNERTRATYIAANFQALMDTGQLRVLDGDTELAPGVWGVVTPGHTPGHMSVRFESGGQHAAFVCDMASYAVHFEKLAWMTAYDVEPLVTLETKRQWQKWALETNALIIFPHDPKRVVGRLVIPENGAPRIEAVEEPYV